MNTYEEVRNWIFRQLPVYQNQGVSAYKPNLNKMFAFMDYLDNPQKALSIIHVAGTNGKGSTSHMITSILMEAGYKVGLYTSPHLKDFTERVRINGVEIEQNYIVDFVKKNHTYFVKAELSFFELTVGLAFTYFKDMQVDIAVIEVGLGGRLDATNVVLPILSIITNIGMDHTQFLGNTLQEIAREKAGIIKEKVPVVIGETQEETTQVFKKIATHLNTPIIWADQEKQVFYDSDLKGSYQKKNILTAVVSLKTLRMDRVKEKHIKQGLLKVETNTGLKGRWQTLGKNPLIIADVTHNVEGFAYVIEEFAKIKYKSLHIILGIVKEKDLDSIFDQLPKHAKYYFCAPDSIRARKVSDLMTLSKQYGFKAKEYISVEMAYKSAVENAKKEDFIYIGGSTFVVSEIL